MAITKTGNKLLGTVATGIKNFGSKAMRFAVPAMVTATAANDIMSGQRSVGGAVGDALGAYGGYELARRGMDMLNKRRRVPYLSSAAGFVVPLMASMYAGDVGGNLLKKVMPWRRTPVNFDNYLQ